MLLHQATYGPQNGHALLACTTRELEVVFRDAAFRSDLPQTAPAGVTWLPFFRLVEHEDWLLFVHTRPAEAEARAGMVRSRAVLIPKTAASGIHDLGLIATELRRDISSTAELHPINTSVFEYGPIPNLPTLLEEAIAEGFVRNGKQSAPLVVLSQDGFDAAMLGLWHRSPPELRTSLTFGLSFGPDDVQGLAVVCTPKSLQARWNLDQLVDLERADSTSASAEVLLNTGKGKNIREFATQAGIALSAPTVLAVVVDAVRRLGAPASAANDIFVLRTVAERGSISVPMLEPLAGVFTRLVATSGEWTVDQVQSLRNIDLNLDEATRPLHDALAQRVTDLLMSEQAVALVDILRSLAHGKARRWWLQAVSLGTSVAFKNECATDAMFDAVWKAVESAPSEASKVACVASAAANFEERLLRVLPSRVEPRLAEALSPSMIELGLPAVAGKLLARSQEISCAVGKAVALTTVSTHAFKQRMLESLLTEYQDEATVLEAISSNDEILLQYAVKAAIRAPKVLQGFDWTKPAWYRLFGRILSVKPSAVALLPDAANGMSRAIASQLTDKDAWDVVSRTSLADLSQVANRADAWSLLPAVQLERVLGATAAGWLSSIENVAGAGPMPEEPLGGRVYELTQDPVYMCEVARHSPAQVSHYLKRFGFTSPQAATDFLNELVQSHTTLSEGAAESIGKWISTHKWTQVADFATGHFHDRPDFHPLLKACYLTLSPWNIAWIAFRLHLPINLTQEQAWEAFENEATELYARGPSDREIWGRSGGDYAHLDLSGTGREQWHRCVRQLRQGLGPGVEPLLREMACDYHNREVLPQLLNIRFWDRK